METPMFATEGRVIVREDAPEEETEGGIVIPKSVSQDVTTGVVVDLGPGEYLECGKRKDDPCRLGDRILFESHAGTVVEHEGETYRVLAGIECLAVLRY